MKEAKEQGRGLKARTQALNKLQCGSSKQKGSDKQVKKII